MSLLGAIVMICPYFLTVAMGTGNESISPGMNLKGLEKKNHGKRQRIVFLWHIDKGVGKEEPWKKTTNLFPMVLKRRRQNTKTMGTANSSIFYGINAEGIEKKNHGKK